jgi:hypothetical protein
MEADAMDAVTVDADRYDGAMSTVTTDDWPVHVLEGTCWCQPVIDYEDPVTGAIVFIHRASIDGLAYEPEPPT